MHLVNVAIITRMLLARRMGAVEGGDIPFGSIEWFVYAGVSCFLVLFAGIMSGLTLGLMSLGLVDLEILQRSGTATEKKQAGIILAFSRLCVLAPILHDSLVPLFIF